MPIRTQPVVRYRPEHDPFAEDIRNLLEKARCTQDCELLADMVSTVLKLARDKTPRGDLKILSTAVKELRYALRVFATYRDTPKVSMFGSARTPREDPAYQQAEDFARKMTDAGWMVITGAGGGIMEAGHGGAGREKSFGVAIRLPFEQLTNTFIEKDPKLINFKYFFTRKLMFVKEAKAVVLLPGGFGTHDEGFEVLTLVQTGKASPMPLVFLNAPGDDYWLEWDAYIKRHILKRNLISPEDLKLYHITDSYEEAVTHILHFYRRYHSSRYVHDNLVIRLSAPLAEGGIDLLNQEFADIMSGPITAVSALPEEENEDEKIRALPRLLAPFNRRSFGRLREMIDRINEL